MKKFILLFLFAMPFTLQAEVLKVCATVPELAALAKEVGGDRISVTSFVRPKEDPHFVDARPAFIRQLNAADAYLQMGMELEIGFAPVLLRQARNSKVLIGQPGHIDASVVITPRDVPQVQVDRSMGDVHAMGSPHYLTDPSAGLLVARLIKERFQRIDPAGSSVYESNYRQFEKKLSEKLFGAKLSNRLGSQRYKLAELLHRGGYSSLYSFLLKNNMAQDIGGWLAATKTARRQKFTGDHRATWAYFASAFGLTIPYNMEKTAGIEPSTSYLAELSELMKSGGVRFILSSAYYNPRYAQFLAKQSGAKILPMANQAGSRPGTDDYISFIEYNVKLVSNP